MTYFFGEPGYERAQVEAGIYRDKLGWLYDDVDEPLHACRNCRAIGHGNGVTFLETQDRGEIYECLTCGVEADIMEPDKIERRAKVTDL